MERISNIALLVISIVLISFTAAPAHAQSLAGGDVSLVAAVAFPYDIVEENYVPSLYFASPQSEDERLVVVPDFPYETCDLCYSPSLYYEEWKITKVQALK